MDNLNWMLFKIGTLLVAMVVAAKASALRVVKEQVILDNIGEYELCQSKDYSGEWCHDALVRWVKDHPNDAMKAGKMTRAKMNAWGAIPFFAQAFAAKKGDCNDQDVKLAVVDGLGQPADTRKDIVDQAKKIGLDTCFKEMKDAIVADSSPDGYLFTNACKELVAKGAISGLKAKKCKG